jgi:hypothetical protein
VQGKRDGAAQESNLPTVGLPRLTGFEDQLGHRARPLRWERNLPLRHAKSRGFAGRPAKKREARLRSARSALIRKNPHASGAHWRADWRALMLSQWARHIGRWVVSNLSWALLWWLLVAGGAGAVIAAISTSYSGIHGALRYLFLVGAFMFVLGLMPA